MPPYPQGERAWRRPVLCSDLGGAADQLGDQLAPSWRSGSSAVVGRQGGVKGDGDLPVSPLSVAGAMWCAARVAGDVE